MESRAQRSSWSSGLVALFLIGALGAGFSHGYRQAINDLFHVFSTEEYSYLAITFAILVAIASTTLSRAEVLDKPRISRVLIALIYFTSSGILWTLSTTLIENVFVLRMASLAIFIWGLAVLLYSVNGLKMLFYLLFTLLFLIPIPKEVLEHIAIYLSRNVGYVVSLITGSKLVVEGMRTYLDYGSGMLEIVYGCSGVVGLSSIAALIPLLLYVVRNSSSVKRRILAVVVGFAVGSLVAYVGNVLRISTVVWISRSMGIDTALGFFHSVPSLLYSSIAAMASIIAAFRVARPDPSTENMGGTAGSREPRMASLLLFSLIIVVASLMLFSLVAPYTIPRKTELKIYSYDYVVNNMDTLVFSNETRIIFSKPVPALERVLGSSIVEGIRIDFEGRVYDGYIEFAETPARFHSWWVCLAYQGYRVVSMWRNEYGGTMVVHLNYLDRYGNSYLLAYTVYTIPIHFGGAVGYGYIRISLIEPVLSSIRDVEERLGRALVEGTSKDLRTLSSKEGLGATENILYIRIYYTMLAISTAYYILSYTYTGLHYLYKRIATYIKR